jgi:GntR family transcriptional regulator/MocR family aminotransferase
MWFGVYHYGVVKRAGGFGLALPPRERGTPARRWLYAALRAAILHGQLRPGARLPSTRELALQHGLSRGTIVNAFAQLASEGYLDSATGSGTYVSAVLPDELLQAVARASIHPPAGQRARRRLSRYGRRVVGDGPLAAPPGRAFQSNVPALEQFPTALWAQIASRRLRRTSAAQLMGCGAAGYRPLCEAIADYLASSRGVSCTPEQVLIVSGVREGLEVMARMVLDPGDTVCMEEPGYQGAARMFRALGARVTTAPVDDEGMQLRPAPLRGARLLYVTPAHHYPLGVAMSLPRRLALLAWARRTGALVFEDDYDSEYRYAGRSLPALQGLDRAGQVVFAGSFSKVLFPSLRLGYLVLPANLVERVTAARSITHRHPPMLE